MKQFKVELVYCGLKTTLDLLRVVAISHPKSGKFLIYFEKAVMDAFREQGFKFDKGYSTGYRQTDHHYICTELGLKYSVDSGD